MRTYSIIGLIIIAGLSYYMDSIGCLISSISILLYISSRIIFHSPVLRLIVLAFIPVIVLIALPNSDSEGNHIERLLAIKASWRMFLDHSLLGVGFDNWMTKAFDYWDHDSFDTVFNLSLIHISEPTRPY